LIYKIWWNKNILKYCCNNLLLTNKILTFKTINYAYCSLKNHEIYYWNSIHDFILNFIIYGIIDIEKRKRIFSLNLIINQTK